MMLIHVVFLICTAVSLPVLGTKVNVAWEKHGGKKDLGNVNKMLDGPAAFSVQGRHLCHLCVYFASEIFLLNYVELALEGSFTWTISKHLRKSTFQETFGIGQ